MDADQSNPDALRRELQTNREKVARLERDTRRAVHELGRHLANLGLDGGYAELGDLIEKVENLRGSLKATDEEIAYVERLAGEYEAYRRELDATRHQAKALFARVERQIGRLGERVHAWCRRADAPARWRKWLEEVRKGNGDPDKDPPAGESAPDGIPGRLRSLRRALDPRGRTSRRAADGRQGRLARLGWLVLKTDFEQHVDGELRGLFETVRKNLVSLMELERHRRHREEGLGAFDREMLEEWGYPDIEAMRRDLDRQRTEMRAGIDSLYTQIGDMFNRHRLHHYVDDSFVAACRHRLKRFHVRINQLKLRQKDILLALKET